MSVKKKYTVGQTFLKHKARATKNNYRLVFKFKKKYLVNDYTMKAKPVLRKMKPLKMYILSNSRHLHSTQRLFEEGRKRNHEMRVYPPLSLTMQVDKNQNVLYFEKQRLSLPDVIIPRVGQTKAAYVLAVVRQFEILGVSSLNSSAAITRSRDKLRSLQILAQNSIAVPKTFFLDSHSDVELALEIVGGTPVIIKVPEGTQGMGVVLAESFRSAKSMLDTMLSTGKHMLVQEFIAEAQNSDLRVIVVDDRIVTAMKRTSVGDEFRSNVHRGGSHEATKLSIEAEITARNAAKILGLRVAGVDLIESKRGYLVLEVNPSPGLAGIEAATQMNVAERIVQHAEVLARYKPKLDSIGF